MISKRPLFPVFVRASEVASGAMFVIGQRHEEKDSSMSVCGFCDNFLFHDNSYTNEGIRICFQFV